MIDPRVCVDVVVDGVGVALAVPLVGGGGRGSGLDRGHRLPHSHICPITKGLDGITYTRKVIETISREKHIFFGGK